ncbi:MAG: glycosyltransferase [Gemmatimonadota bacterium]|nr:glycosyltransferase [Gemmatimonadota bacterium]
MPTTTDESRAWRSTAHRRPDRRHSYPRGASLPVGLPTQFHVLSFEGPDAYSRAGGIASRVTGLTRTLADTGHDTHLWFVGDPISPGHEVDGSLHLHRWCQWLSRSCPAGVYDGEDAKRADYAASLPPYLVSEMLLPHLAAGGRAVVLAEEWHTVDAVLHLDWLLRGRGVRHLVTILWNANNTFGFSHVPWDRLAGAARIVTVSRYMKSLMGSHVDDVEVVPNGLPPDAYDEPDPEAVQSFSNRVRDRLCLAKVGRWDPGKRWLGAVEGVAELKERGERPLLIARGGIEEHGREVFARANELGLRVRERTQREAGPSGLLEVLEDVDDVDVLSLTAPLSPAACRLLFRGAAAVLADSEHEPFGLVGLEAMAVGGVACTGGTGEDYAKRGRNAIVLAGGDPREMAGLLSHLRQWPEAVSTLAGCALETARDYAWHRVIDAHVLPLAQATVTSSHR